MANVTFEAVLPFDPQLPPIVPGTTWKWSFQLVQDDDASTPINTTGYTFLMQMRERANANVVAIEISIANGRCVMTASQGLFVISLPPADTLTLAPYNQLVYDAQLYDTLDTLPFLAGSVPILSPVTRI